MNFNLFRIKLIVYIVLLVSSSIASLYFAIASPFWLLSGWAFLLVILSSVLLIRESERSKRELYNFISAITFGEFKNTYKLRRKNDDLAKAFDDLISVYRNLSTEKERNHSYLQTIVEHINIVLLCFDKEENIVILNEAAKRFFNRSNIQKINVIERFDQPLSSIVKEIRGGQKKLYKFSKLGTIYNVSIHATEFKLQDKPYKLVSIRDVRFELEEQELDSWRKLVRVLTHEIMNTAIPISTLAGVTNQLLLDEKGNEKDLTSLNQEDQSDLRHSLKTIEKRSKGIVEFVKATKSYTNMPAPKFEKANLKQIIQNVIDLLRPGFEDKNIKIVLEANDGIADLDLDIKLIEQLLINILKNSMDALEKSESGLAKISLKSVDFENRTMVEIADNGSGMNQDILENIFIPFYTTKREGSGIGLSLSKQIMKMHNGTIEVRSVEAKGTTITLTFRD
ncbi:MAG: hypothetical protein KKG99_02340 [Bacteroidetes bacterium]|nr:hypothetical protein [Bacteroidota bacterium]